MKGYAGWMIACLVCISVLHVSAAPITQDTVSSFSSQSGSEQMSSLSSQTEEEEAVAAYLDYEKRFGAIQTIDELTWQGFDPIPEQTFSVTLESFGEEEVLFVPALETESHRLAVFLADGEGRVLYKCNQLATNYLYKGSLKQPTKGIASIAFQDANGDGLTDIILITACSNDFGEYAGKSYKTGDVLFQKEGGFYRDYRISDTINRFSMNKSANCILAYVKNGHSAEFLYTASTEAELLQHGFEIIEEQCYTRNFEKLGKLRVVPGIFQISEYDLFMIYLVDEQGTIVWSFQPMEDHENLYSLKGITGKDVDGDGMKDLVVLARYSSIDLQGEPVVESDCAIYYQRTGGFDIDTEFQKQYTCTEETTMEELVVKIRGYWGWSVDVETGKGTDET